MRNYLSKALRAQSRAGIDIRESRIVCNGRSLRKDGKRSSKRAQRRLDQAIIGEQRETTWTR